VQDFRCTPPQRLVVARSAPGQDGFDTLAFFLRDPEFAELMTHYRPRDSAALQSYERIDMLHSPETACRSGV
jgi:hypothetical protein